MPADEALEHLLLLRAAGESCGLPLRDVIEVMRPLRLRPLPAVAPYVLGATVTRGRLAPVIDLAALMTGRPGLDQRWVSLRLGQRTAVLSVDAVAGVSRLPAHSVSTLPPLLDSPSMPLTDLRARDAGLLAVLEAARLVPQDTWAQIDLQGARAA